MNETDSVIYPTRAYDLLTDSEREAVENYVQYAVEQQRSRHQRVIAALNLPIPNEYIRRSRQMLYRPVVRAAIAERIQEEAQVYDISPDRVIKENATIAFSDVTDFLRQGFSGEVVIKDLNDIPAEKAGAIKSIESKPGMMGISYKITLHDKLPALKALSDMMGLTAPERPPVLTDYVKQELRTMEQKQIEAPEAEYTELLESVNKEGVK